MKGVLISINFIFCCFLLFLDSSTSLPLCVDSSAPFILNSTLEFCPYNGSTCCNSTEDTQIQKQFQLMNISDTTCASALKSILCARCDPYSAELFTVQSTPRSVPLLCNSTIASNSSQSKAVAVEDFCSQVWESCQSVSIKNSPFSPSLQGQAGRTPSKSNPSKLTDQWQSKTDFCTAFGGSSTSESVCFEGEPVALKNTDSEAPISPPHGLCLEKIGNGSYLNMVAHPDGTNRAFFSNQKGQVWLATIPADGSGGQLQLDESSPFVDLTDMVYSDAKLGMMGMAFHPKFAENGRFFASFTCDKDKWSGCNGICSCNSNVNCDPSKIGTGSSGAQPCQYQAVVAEYTANGTASQPSSAVSAKPTEVRRIFTMGLPSNTENGGQILFGPNDGYLYFMMGDGSGTGDPYNFAQNKKSLLGKIMRLDIDNIPSAAEISKQGLWGSYSIPKDNPFSQDNGSQAEIWALGLKTPWRCSFDSERPSYFFCGDAGQDLYEEVDLITKGGNYGWRVYEGPYPFTPNESPGGNTSKDSINPIMPILGYNHSEVNKNEGSACIIGGYMYRSNTDPCMYGRYLYADLYSVAVWEATEDPVNSGNFSKSRIPFSCSHDSPIKCDPVPGTSLPALGYIYSFGEDNNKDVYILASEGVYRVVRPSRCSYTCSQEKATTEAPSPSTSPSHACRNFSIYQFLQISFFLLLLICFV
ncbi:HIPL1 protein [Arachis ipaensis]|uniref:HIPL1 protein n=1 Tax=Arachis ipaensis TaxID=130454 RepID=UPI0007AFB3FE|nr:HIPL1 protein [Arachis ipaensis]